MVAVGMEAQPYRSGIMLLPLVKVCVHHISVYFVHNTVRYVCAFASLTTISFRQRKKTLIPQE